MSPMKRIPIKAAKVNSGLEAAVECRRHGWAAGTKLIGDEGYGPEVIQITAIGERSILAKSISRDDKPVNDCEGTWTLSCRDWKEIK